MKSKYPGMHVRHSPSHCRNHMIYCARVGINKAQSYRAAAMNADTQVSSCSSPYRIQCNSSYSNRSPYRIQCNSSSNRSPYRIQCNSSSNRSPYRIQCNSSSNRSPYRIQCNSSSNYCPDSFKHVPSVAEALQQRR